MNDAKELFIAIDPGKAGAITLFDKKDFTFYFMPYKKVETGELLKSGKPKMKSVFDEEGIRKIVFEIASKYRGYKKFGIIEDVGGREGWSAQNNFEFGRVAGLQRMILIMLGCEYLPVKPQKWQSEMYRHFKKIMKPSSTGKTMIHDTKATSAMVAQELAPGLDFRKTERSKNIDDNKTDSFLMLLYLYTYIHKNSWRRFTNK